MSNTQELIQLGKELALEGKELRDWVSHQDELARDERAQQRQIEREKEEKSQLREEHDRAEKERERQFELRKLELQRTSTPHSVNERPMLSGHKPKIPLFDERKDDISAYIFRFENYAGAENWPEEQWANYLSNLLTGKALTCFASLSIADSLDYGKLKDVLLKTFDCTCEGYREKFRNARHDIKESFSQFYSRMNNYCKRWIELEAISTDYESLFDLILREQFLQSVNRDLAIFLKERRPRNIQDMVRHADYFREAHPGRNLACPTQNGQVMHYAKFDRPKGNNLDDQRNRFSNGKPDRLRPRLNEHELKQKYPCKRCNQYGHWYRDPQCPARQHRNTERNTVASHVCITGDTATLECGHTIPVLTSMKQNQNNNLPVTRGHIEGQPCVVLRDSGCSGVGVRKSLVPESAYIPRNMRCVMFDGSIVNFPTCRIHIDTTYYTGEVEAVVVPNPPFDLVLGNIPGVKWPNETHTSTQDNPASTSNIQREESNKYVSDQEIKAHVLTRNQVAQEQHKVKPLVTTPALDIGITPLQFQIYQKDDKTLTQLWNHVSTNKVFTRKYEEWRFMERDGIMYRVYSNKKKGIYVDQAIVPRKLRHTVLSMAHDSLFSGHLGTKKTVDRILSSFHWPGIFADAQRFCRSCDSCQRVFPKGKNKPVPMIKMPIIDVPFRKVGIDLVGPLDPPTENGKHRYILTLIDYATRYAEATPLKSIDTITVAEALVDMFARVGVPQEVLSDQGTQFVSDLMKEVSRLLSIKQLVTTPFHPQTNGLVERFHGTLKSMLKKVASERPRDWNRYIPSLLFAYREVPSDSLGFSPFQLLYGRTVRGPMSILRELWTKDIEDTEVKTTYQYVVDLRNRLEETCKLAKKALQNSSSTYKKHFDKRAKPRTFKKGDKVLLMLPTENNKLLMQWRGPYEVIEDRGMNDYAISIKGKVKIYHINLLRRYVERLPDEPTPMNAAIIYQSTDDEDLAPILQPKETHRDVNVNPNLTEKQHHEVTKLLESFKDILTDIPGAITVEQHSVKLTTTEPIRVKQYPLPFTTAETIKKEVKEMQRLGIIESSKSPYCSPVVLVKKKDNTMRFCVDFRRINNVTVFDAEPIGDTDLLFTTLSNKSYHTKIDLSCGYWQVGLTDDSKEITAFSTPLGLFQFRRMPFGMVNSGATFCRAMRKVLGDIDDTCNFVDDILIASDTWEKHLITLQKVMGKLRTAGFTARPTKMSVGYNELEFLGHIVGNGHIKPVSGKVEKILDIERPTTKKQVRSLIGLVTYYAKFIENCSKLTAPLSDLTKKGNPNTVIWNRETQNALEKIKAIFSSRPILKLPSFDEPFTIRTDASDTALGAILLQEHKGEMHPVLYASRKLHQRETRYTVQERELLAVVWAIQRFERYVFGKEFIIETDHSSLTFLNKSKHQNNRIMRWALILQKYRFRVISIPGNENIGADLLSRCPLKQ